MSDRWGARAVMYQVLGGCAIGALLLIVPRMDLYATGEGVVARKGGTVEAVTEGGVVVSSEAHPVLARVVEPVDSAATLILPTSDFWQEPVVRPGDQVVKKQLLARGVTHIHFQANIWIFTVIVFVGGIVGVLGGLGGFVCPILFGGMLRATGIWTTCWLFLFVLSAGALAWMHVVVRNLERRRAPALVTRIDHARPQEKIA
jgi:NNP family nitrate/nitrite transporter-like MFS transporter